LVHKPTTDAAQKYSTFSTLCGFDQYSEIVKALCTFQMRKHYKCAVNFNGVEVEAKVDQEVEGYM